MRRARSTLLGAVTSLVVVAATVPSVGEAARPCNADWPTFQHDAARTASVTCTGLTPLAVPALRLKWFLKTTSQVTAEPAISWGHAFVGDGTGRMHAVGMTTGKDSWTFDVTHNKVHVDRHAVSYGLITSSATVADIPSLGPTVFFGGGGTVYAVDARTGAPRWAVDVDPEHPTSTAEVESSPVVWRRPARAGGPVVFVGMDTNEDGHSANGGVLAFAARTGALIWKYDAQRSRVVHRLTDRSLAGSACGDIWSSPSLDARRGMLFFGSGNCDLQNGGDTQRLTAIRAATGRRVWAFAEPAANHGRDMDFGASAVLTTVGGRDVVVQAGKSGWVYVVDRRTGRLVRAIHPAEGSAIGGFIGSVAVAVDPATGHPLLYGDTAIPVSPDGPDPAAASDPTQLTSLHAVDLATGVLVWNSPAQTPSYAPVTVAGGVVFAPDTTQFSVNAYRASDGVPLWHWSVAAATSGGVAVSGRDIVVGAGTYLAQGTQMPPQAPGIWCFEASAA